MTSMLGFVAGLGAIVLTGVLIVLVLWPSGSRVSGHSDLMRIVAALVLTLCAASIAIIVCELFWLAPLLRPTALAWIGWLTVGALAAGVLLACLERSDVATFSITRRRALAGIGGLAVADLVLAVIAKNKTGSDRFRPARTAIGAPVRTAFARVNGANIYCRESQKTVSKTVWAICCAARAM